MNNLWRTALAAVFCITLFGQSLMADDEPPRAENGNPLVVRDVAVYLLSAYGTKLNERGLFQSSMPSYTLSRRPTASRDTANDPIPAGIITFSGPADEDVDVLLEFDNGRFLTNWPPGRTRSKRLLWPSIDIADEPSIEPSTMPDGHWLLPLREAERLYVVGNKHADRFLMYDAELPYAPHVSLKRVENGYTVTNTGKFPIHDVVVYRPADERAWEVATAAEVEAAGKKDADAEQDGDDSGEEQPPSDGKPAEGEQPSPAPAASPAAADVRDAAVNAEAEKQAAEEAAVAEGAAEAAVAVEAVADAPAAAALPAAANDQPATSPDAEESEEEETKKSPQGTTAPASLVGTLTADDAMNAWRDTLAALNLELPEIEFVLSILRRQALKTDSAMLVYRMDETQIENLLPLEVTPYPDRVFRVALVIVQDADPDLQSQIEALVAKLGHDEWKQREAAQKELAELGLAAKPKLESALKSDDAEIVFRAEQLMEALQTTP